MQRSTCPFGEYQDDLGSSSIARDQSHTLKTPHVESSILSRRPRGRRRRGGRRPALRAAPAAASSGIAPPPISTLRVYRGSRRFGYTNPKRLSVRFLPDLFRDSRLAPGKQAGAGKRLGRAVLDGARGRAQHEAAKKTRKRFSLSLSLSDDSSEKAAQR